VANALAFWAADCSTGLSGRLPSGGEDTNLAGSGRHPLISRFSAQPSLDGGRWSRLATGNLLLVNLAPLWGKAHALSSQGDRIYNITAIMMPD
jgi:hypothetical protein